MNREWEDEIPRFVQPPSLGSRRPRRRVLSEDEVDKLLMPVEHNELYEPVMVALHTGARRGERDLTQRKEESKPPVAGQTEAGNAGERVRQG